MPTASAQIATIEASRLIKRLCTHWAHRFEVQFDADSGTVPFDATTTARFRATDDHLYARIEAADTAALERFQGVVESHLQRMARAGELTVEWKPEDTGA